MSSTQQLQHVKAKQGQLQLSLQMETKNLILLLASASFFIQYLCSHATAVPSELTSSPVPMQDSVKLIDSKEHHNNNDSGGNGISQMSKTGHGFGSQGGNGGESGSNGGGEANNGGGSHPYPQGGAAVIPLYAGAAKGHHNSHRNAGSCIQNCAGTSIFLAAVVLAHVIYIKL